MAKHLSVYSGAELAVQYGMVCEGDSLSFLLGEVAV